MPRGKNGGARQGQQGKGYVNRTDLLTNRDFTPEPIPAPQAPQGPPQAAPPAFRTPEDSPMLTDPTQRPDEPITAGLNIGPGPGATDPRLRETQQLKKYLPLIEPYLDTPGTPDSVKTLFRYIRGA